MGHSKLVRKCWPAILFTFKAAQMRAPAWHQSGGQQTAVITAGFPCQGQQFHDDCTLLDFLRAAYPHQGAELILERVQTACNNDRVGVEDVVGVRKWQIAQVHWDLKQLPMRRARWCLIPSNMPAPALRP